MTSTYSWIFTTTQPRTRSTYAPPGCSSELRNGPGDGESVADEPGSQAVGIAVGVRLIESVETRWCAVGALTSSPSGRRKVWEVYTRRAPPAASHDRESEGEQEARMTRLPTDLDNCSGFDNSVSLLHSVAPTIRGHVVRRRL